MRFDSTPLSRGVFISAHIPYSDIDTPGKRLAVLAELAATLDAAFDEATAAREAKRRLAAVMPVERAA